MHSHIEQRARRYFGLCCAAVLIDPGDDIGSAPLRPVTVWLSKSSVGY